MEAAKILEALRTKYAALGLGDKILTGFATKIAKTATDETLTQQIEDIEPDLQIWQSVLDGHRKEISELKKQSKPLEPKKEQPKEVEPKSEKDKTLELLESLVSEVKGLKADKVQSSRASRYSALFDKVSDAEFKQNQLAKFNMMNFNDEADFDAFVESESKYIEKFNQAQVNDQLRGVPPMIGGDFKSKPSNEEIEKMVDNMKF